MAEHIIDAFITRFILDRSDFKKGVEEVEQDSKRLRENQRKTFGDIEETGKKTGESIKAVTREVVGLGLAFMGAKSIAGFIKDMATGAASADRFGQTLGMSVKQVWAWRQAMKSVGGQAGEGDAALQRIQQIRMGLQTGNVDPSTMLALGRLGVGVTDLQKGDAGSVLSKLAGASNKMNPQLYASLLQQVGLPQSTIYFLQKGQAKVDEMLKQFAANADQQEQLATETEKLQQSITSLQTTLEQKVAKPLTTIADWINKVMGNDQKSGGNSAGSSGHWWDPFIPKDDQGRPLWGGGNPSHAPMKGQNGPSSGGPGVRIMGWTPRGADGNSNASVDNKIGIISRKLGVNPDQPLTHDQFLRQDMTALEGRAAGRHNYGNMRNKDGSWRQFSSPGEYLAAQTAWLERRWKEGARTVRDAVEGRLVSAGRVDSGRAFARMTRMPPSIARSGGGSTVNVGPITIHTQAKNASEIARALPAELRRRGVIIQADRGMTP